MSLAQLRERAKELNLKKTSLLRKPELVALIAGHEAEKPVEMPVDTVIKAPAKRGRKPKPDVAEPTPTDTVEKVKRGRKPKQDVPEPVTDFLSAGSSTSTSHDFLLPETIPDLENIILPGNIDTTHIEAESIEKTEILDVLAVSTAVDEITTPGSDSDGQQPIAVVEEHPQQCAPEPQTAEGILEILPDGFGFLRVNNFLPSSGDVYISPTQIRRFNLRTGDLVCGTTRHGGADKFSAISYIQHVNGDPPYMATRRPYFEYLTPIFPTQRITLETPDGQSTRHQLAPRLIDLLSPIGFGQRGMIVSPPKAGKTVLLKQIANAITRNHPDVHLIVLLIDERPEEVTDMQRSILGEHCTVVSSTFDEQPENHKRVAEMVLERAKRLVEQKKDLVILMDSITRLGRAYNLTIPAGGRTLSGGLDPAALYMPKKFFGAARNIEEGGSLTVLATALVDTGSKMDDVIFEEFKGTGNMELVLDRRMAERRVFPAIDIMRSGTRREELLLSSRELDAMYTLREMSGRISSWEFSEKVADMLLKSQDNKDFVNGFVEVKRY